MTSVAAVVDRLAAILIDFFRAKNYKYWLFRRNGIGLTSLMIYILIFKITY